MGASQSEPAQLGPDLLQVECATRQGVSGVYRKWSDVRVDIPIRKKSGDRLGVTVNLEGTLRAVEEDSVAAQHGLAKHIGQTVVNKEVIDACLTMEELVLTMEEPVQAHNGLEVWAKGTFHLYSTREGKWMLTDSREGVDRNSGYAMTSAHGGTKLPHELAWLIFNRDSKCWCEEPSFAVFPYTAPDFRVGQLVEFRSELAATKWQPGIVTAVHPLPENEDNVAGYRQYGMLDTNVFSVQRQPCTRTHAHTHTHTHTDVKKGTEDDVSVFASCVRPHQAYAQAMPLARVTSGTSKPVTPATPALPVYVACGGCCCCCACVVSPALLWARCVVSLPTAPHLILLQGR